MYFKNIKCYPLTSGQDLKKKTECRKMFDFVGAQIHN